MNTISEQWEAFNAQVVPDGAPPVQRQEMRRAFYAGVIAVLGLQARTLSDLSEEGSVAMMEGWHKECRQFALEVIAGIS